MEFLNRIELQGIVSLKKIQSYGDKSSVLFNMVTNYAYTSKDGMPVIDTTWFQVLAWEGKAISRETAEAIDKGSWVRVTGRLRMYHYTTAEGTNQTAYQVVARKVDIVENDEQGRDIRQRIEIEREDDGDENDNNGIEY